MADRARDPEAIEREIERTREELARSIDLLADRLSPKKAVQRSLARSRAEADHVVGDLGSMLGRGSRDSRPRSRLTGPVLVGAGVIVAASAIWLLRRRRR